MKDKHVRNLYGNQALLGARISDLEQRLDTALRGSEQRAARLDALEAGQGHLRDDMSMVGADVAGLLERSSHPTPHPDPRCEAVSPDDAEARCYLWEGHDGEHVSWPVALKWNDYASVEWGDPQPETECCGRGPACGACKTLEATVTASTSDWTDNAPPVTEDEPCPICHDKDCEGAGPRPPCPPDRPACEPPCDDCGGQAEPVPQWRALVDEHDGSDSTFGPLAEVLGCMHSLAASANAGDEVHEGIGWNLARIIAVCEAQVGDGWQADPDEWPMTPNLTTLMGYLSDPEFYPGYGDTRWDRMGEAAAAWLRDLTQDGAQ